MALISMICIFGADLLTFLSFNMISFNPRKRIKEFMKLMNAGMSCPKNLALSLTVGICLALFPVIGMTFLLGLMVAIVFRLNHLIVQSLNLLLAPVQLLLIYPFIKAGNLVFAGSRFFNNLFSYTGEWTFLKFLELITGGVVVWFILSIITMPVLYFFLVRMLNSRLKATETVKSNNELL
jgi:uncharacterized protein (DUF2062 family)